MRSKPLSGCAHGAPRTQTESAYYRLSMTLLHTETTNSPPTRSQWTVTHR
uniref:Uncharacterized protein n=1 Tax=Siphoviridae sp. ct3CA7 TaxID=2823561 RepID=A0A8S5LF60_9CAUD|nr:MAG TPA: hypothetical protein [Siphoviridae sp. ct3CA7]